MIAYEEEEQLRALLEKKFESVVEELVGELVQKYAPRIVDRLRTAIGSEFEPNSNRVQILIREKQEAAVKRAVDDYLRLYGGPAELSAVVYKAVGEKLEPTINSHVQRILDRRVETAIKLLTGKQ